jgi:uncharacterized protein YbgA (DUF1722 family)/uncharacterized protein YbbK (DUF523 family)
MIANRRYGDESRLRLGVSACLRGTPVRFDGGQKRDTFLTDTLARFVEWVPVCPEEEAGLTEFAADRVPQLAALDLDGFVLKKDSPSCGLVRVKMYSERGVSAGTGRGPFAAALCTLFPTLPVEDEGRLHDPAIREHFIERLYACRRVRRLLKDHARVGDLVQFHTRHKLQLLAHSPAQYAALGRVVAHAAATAPERVLDDYKRAFATALRTIATRAGHVNVLQHAAGHFRRVLSTAACRDVAAAIVEYQNGLTPLVVPIRLIEHYARLHDVRYVCNQVYFNPYPPELRLRNHV